MKSTALRLLAGTLLVSAAAWAQAIPLASLEPKGIEASVASYQGREATRLLGTEADGLAILKGSAFQNGAIEVDVAGKPAAGAFEGARGFVGMAFRVQGDGSPYEAIYLRPTNGRADDQLRRNHSTQYVSEPEWTWNRLRQETPGVYESYVDLAAGAWTNYRVVVNGTRAELYVNGADQPCLIVKDLKLGETTGAVALWIGVGTEGYFSNLKVTPR